MLWIRCLENKDKDAFSSCLFLNRFFKINVGLRWCSSLCTQCPLLIVWVFMFQTPWFLPNCGLKLGWIFVPMVTRRPASSHAWRLSVKDLRMPRISEAPTEPAFMCQCKNMWMVSKKTLVQVHPSFLPPLPKHRFSRHGVMSVCSQNRDLNDFLFCFCLTGKIYGCTCECLRADLT